MLVWYSWTESWNDAIVLHNRMVSDSKRHHIIILLTWRSTKNGTAQTHQDPYYQTSKSHKSYAPTSKALLPTRSHATIRHKGKEISKPIIPTSESASEEDSDPEQAQKDKEMQKNLALIANTHQYAIGDQLIKDKSTDDEPGKLNVEVEVVSMVTVPIYQASSSVPPLSTLNLGSRVYTLELKDLPHKINEAVRDNVKEARDELLAKKDKSRKRRRDDQDPHPPPPDSDQSKRRRHDAGSSGSSQPQAPQSSANALATTYQALAENSLLAKIGDMRTFMNWYCQKMGKTELTQADLEGQAYEVVKPFYLDVIHLQFQMEECHKMLTDHID
ncbi:hypothetical protein Tco_0690541 [Tanacetum coccineum]